MSTNQFKVIVTMGGLAVLFSLALASGGGKGAVESGDNPILSGIEKQVAKDTIKQYEIAKQQGDKMQICVQAGLVAAAQLQAKDQEQYNKWKAQQKVDCAAAGLPAM